MDFIVGCLYRTNYEFAQDREFKGQPMTVVDRFDNDILAALLTSY